MEDNEDQMFVTVKSGRVLLWKGGWNSPMCTVTSKAQSAVLYGDEIVVQFQDGSSTLFQVSGNGTNAYPIRRLG